RQRRRDGPGCLAVALEAARIAHLHLPDASRVKGERELHLAGLGERDALALFAFAEGDVVDQKRAGWLALARHSGSGDQLVDRLACHEADLITPFRESTRASSRRLGPETRTRPLHSAARRT